MCPLTSLDLLRRHVPGPLSWSDIIAGYDFGLADIPSIQDWVQGWQSPLCQRLAALEGEALLLFEETLWAACAEATGRSVPRPGHTRWIRSQDRWRIALLKEALALPCDRFAEEVEQVYEATGCPEDMLFLWRRTPAEVQAFLGDLDPMPDWSMPTAS